MAEGVLSRGAEAVVYLADLLGAKVVVKHRVSKSYRHSDFDREFRYYRTKVEAKVLSDLYFRGVRVPAPIFVDLKNYIIVMEYIDGEKLINLMEDLSEEELSKHAEDLGAQVGLMHSLEIYHGDLTLGNVMLRHRDGKLYIIDFGLSGYSRDVEEYAIDLHLLRRNLLATNPSAYELFFKKLIEGYSSTFDRHELVVSRLEEIRLRGRYVEERLRKRLARERYVE